jgi:hypothetical protein
MKGKVQEIKYKYKNIDFTIKFWVKHPPKQYKFEIHPSVMDIEIYHKGDKMNSIINSDMSFEVVEYLYENYGQLPEKRQYKKATLNKLSKNKKVIKDE